MEGLQYPSPKSIFSEKNDHFLSLQWGKIFKTYQKLIFGQRLKKGGGCKLVLMGGPPLNEGHDGGGVPKSHDVPEKIFRLVPVKNHLLIFYKVVCEKVDRFFYVEVALNYC